MFLLSLSDVACFYLQIRSSINTLLFSGRDFSWIRHLIIAAVILLFNNLLVIFVPTIRDIFGFIGMCVCAYMCEDFFNRLKHVGTNISWFID